MTRRVERSLRQLVLPGFDAWIPEHEAAAFVGCDVEDFRWFRSDGWSGFVETTKHDDQWWYRFHDLEASRIAEKKRKEIARKHNVDLQKEQRPSLKARSPTPPRQMQRLETP